ncbi:prominin-1-A-like [Carassius carassius]|uniref:prominin-1-A-like n=1 Tax=Carassius carassius TaxID=217509 RepID=UPI002868D141|nr:prominin-1-A-like [Carassius carassius]
MLWKTGLIFLCWGLTSGELQDRQSATPAAPARTTLDLGSVPSGVYDTVAYYEPGGIGILFNMMHAFLYVVQPNPFPEDLVVRVAKDKFGAIQSEYQKPENIVLTLQVIYYELGFVVCAALGLLFTVLLPLVGLLFCLCRCCDNCGGEMHQRQRKNADCLRGLLTTLLLTTTFIITAGVLCAYAANQNLSSQLKSMRRLVKSNLKDLHTFANQTPAQIDYLISKYDTVKQHVLHDLENVGVILGGRIHEELGKDVQPALDGVLSMTEIKVEKAIKAMRDTKDALENVSLSLETLQEGTVKLQANLSLVRGSLSNALNDPVCTDTLSNEICRNIRNTLPKLEIAANYSSLSDVTDQLDKVNEVLKTDLGQIVEKGFASFNHTPNLVTDQTRNIVEGVKVLLEDVGSNVTTFTKLFPVHSTLTNFTKMISHTHSQIEDIYPQVDQMDFYRWICCITLCCMVVLILAFNFLGLLCGILGFDRHATPTTRGCVSNTGGNLLMAGVGFSFLFSWVLMGVITALFLAGGNLEKLVCEPFQTRQLFKVLDTPNLVNSAWKNFIPGYLYNDPEMDLTAYSLYSNCKDNRGIYSALHLDKVFNISAFFNTSVVSGSRLCSCAHAKYVKARSTLNQSIRLLERISSDLPVRVRDVLAAVDAAQYLISQNSTFVINQETEKYKQTIIGYFKQYINWIRTSLAQEVATCKPLSNIVDTAEILGCSFLLDSMNTFWFGLGCSTLFLLPSIILSVKLAKFYRRMDTEDVYDDDIGNWN